MVRLEAGRQRLGMVVSWQLLYAKTLLRGAILAMRRGRGLGERVASPQM
jgi:hypothetical protein